MKTLGIYFGPKAISLVEAEGQKIVNNVLIPFQRLSGTGIEEKVPEELKIAAAIKDELRKNNIAAKEANLVLLGRDLIIRTFNMPVLPPDELLTAVRFEAKKYIPFKVEELVYDFQAFLDRANRKNLILFVGVKRESLEKYISIFTQLNIKVGSIEYAGFSILRLLQLAKIKEKGVCAVVDIDLAEEDEVNFIVLENGFPLFSRDIILSGEAPAGDTPGPVKPDLVQSMEKLKVELRISLDFYLRKFPTKNITNILVIAPDDYRQEVESFVRERGIAVKFADIRKFVDRPMAFSLGLFKAYAVSLEKLLKNEIKIDLLPAKIKAKNQEQSSSGVPMVFGFRFDIKFILLAAVIIGIPFAVSYYRMKPVQGELASVLSSRPQVNTVRPDMSLDELNDIDSKYKDKIKVITGMLKGRMSVTGQLDSIPHIIPDGVWLQDLRFRKNDRDFVLTIAGSCYMADSDRERKLINKFLNDLKGDVNFSRYFKSMNILSLDQGQAGKINLTNFVIECRS